MKNKTNFEITEALIKLLTNNKAEIPKFQKLLEFALDYAGLKKGGQLTEFILAFVIAKSHLPSPNTRIETAILAEAKQDFYGLGDKDIFEIIERAFEIKELLEGYIGNILYDAHSLELRIQRSSARQSLENMGSEILLPITTKLEFFVHTPRENWDTDVYIGWMSLLGKIVEKHNLPPLYDSNISYLFQVPKVWIEYCEKHGKNKLSVA